MIDVEPTAQAIDDMARRTEEITKELKSITAKMRKDSDITYASEAINCIANLMIGLRLDLLVTRPLRELMRQNNPYHERVT